MIDNIFKKKEFILPLQNFMCIEFYKKKMFKSIIINLSKSATLFIEKVVVEGLHTSFIELIKFQKNILWSVFLKPENTFSVFYFYFILFVLI